MTIAEWVSIIGLVVQGVLLLFLLGQWKGRQQHVETDHGETLRVHKEEIVSLRKRYHQLSNHIHFIAGRMAISLPPDADES